MIYTYGTSIIGTYHVKNNIVCQDSHSILKCSDDFCIAAVADGLGSEMYSEKASRIAADISTEICAKNIEEGMSDNELEAVIKNAFDEAQMLIEKEAEKNGHEVDQYDTTLSLVVFLKGRIHFGHVGDGGIIALTDEGRYEKVTEPQRDDDGHVFPLCFSDRWVFGTFPKKVASVFLATDGVYEKLFPIYIQDSEVCIHVSLARYLMDSKVLNIEKEGEENVKKKIEAYLQSIPDSMINDDKTVVVLINTTIEPSFQPPEYYTEPNWNELRQKYNEKWRKMAYPNLSKEDFQKGQDDLNSPKDAEETPTANEENVAVGEKEINYDREDISKNEQNVKRSKSMFGGIFSWSKKSEKKDK